MEMATTCLNDQRLQALADGEGDAADRAHAAACAACGARLRDRAALMASIEATLNPPVGLPSEFRLPAFAKATAWSRRSALRGGGKAEATGSGGEKADTSGATRLRSVSRESRSFREGSRRWIYTAAAVAAAVAGVLFIVPAVRKADATVSASEILAKSASQLSAVTRGVEVLEYELVLGGVPKEMVPDQVDGTYRIWQAIDHDVPGRFRFASYAADGRMFSSIAEDPIAKRRVAAFTSEGQAYRFDVTLPAGPRNMSLPEMQRLHMEASIAMMQASGNQLVETIAGPNGPLYRIEVPRVTAPGTNPVWDLTEARVVIDSRDYSVVEFAVQGSFLKSPYSMSYKLLRHVVGATLQPDAFSVPAQPGEIVVTGEGSAVAAHDIVVLALRALAQAKQSR
jgi:hypothetical protein